MTGPATTSVAVNDRLGQHVDAVLGEPPDQRRLPEDPVRVQVHAAVISVAVVEVPVEHEHFVFLKLGQRLRGVRTSSARDDHLVRVQNAARRAARRRSRTATRPPTMVAATAPLSVQPSNGRVLRLRPERGRPNRRTGSPAPGSSGRPGRPQRACRPGRPAAARGSPTAAPPAAADRSRPACTSRSRHSGTAVSSPTMPNGARSNSSAFSSAWCGAWSVAMASIGAVAQALDQGVAVGLLAQRRIHLGVRVVTAAFAQGLVGEHEVMRRHFAGDARRRAPCRRAPRGATAARSCGRRARGRR